MVKSAVRVCVRTRPTAAFAHTELVVKPEDRTIDVNIKKNPNMGVVNNMRENYGFKFDQLLHNSSQDTVYADTISDITKSIVQGYNGTVLVYGQTGAGKTYTMSGGQGDYKARGMIPRAIQEIFTEVRFPAGFHLVCLSLLEHATLGSLLSFPSPTQCHRAETKATPPWRQPRGKSAVNLPQMPPDSGGMCMGVD